MTTSLAIALLAAAGYLIGSIPFGYLIGKARGVNLFTQGSGNIGATNVGRVLGRKFGVLAFVLDLLKGAIPAAAAGPIIDALANPSTIEREVARVLAAAGAFLGHLFPIYLGFRGGKGVAAGAGTVLVLAPGPAAAAIAAWLAMLLATRYVSLASLAAVGVLAGARFAQTLPEMPQDSWPVTAYIVAGALLVAVKHRGNIQRLLSGTEHRVGDGPMRQSLLRVVHVLALGLWFGAAAFFNFAVAPSLNRTFADVVATAPNDRTAFQPLGSPGANQEAKAQLASALFGAGVGPIFPIYFMLSAACGLIVLATAWAWRKDGPGSVHRTRWLLAFATFAAVLTGWLISTRVAELRAARLTPDPVLADAARAAFATWHLISLGLSLITTLLTGVLLAMAAFLPRNPSTGGEPVLAK